MSDSSERVDAAAVRLRRQLVPDAQEDRKLKRRLRPFPPVKLTSVPARIRNAGGGMEGVVLVERYLEEHYSRQLRKLIKDIGLNPDSSDGWRRAFAELARLHYGIGYCEYDRPVNRRRSQTWTDETEGRLYAVMRGLTKDGRSEREAIKIIAASREFPYRENRTVFERKGRPRELALWREWTRIKARNRKTSLEASIVGTELPNTAAAKMQLHILGALLLGRARLRR